MLVAVAPADAGATSQSLARDLVVKLGSLQTANSGSMRLVAGNENSESRERADLLLEVGSATDPATARATLILKDDEGSILWSEDFERASRQLADLEQQLALTTARVLECAMEGRIVDKRLRRDTFKSYLNACSQSAEVMRSDPTPVVRLLAEVVRNAPHFRPAWAKLLMAESEINGVAFNAAEPNPRALAAHRRHIEQAKQLHPGMSEAILAEAMLLPNRHFLRRLELVEAVTAQDPNNANVQAALAGSMISTGRLREGIKAAGGAVELDPLSPATINGFITTLAYAGATDAAKRELEQAERLWPGTATVQDAQFRFHLRYGDPRIAKAIFEKETDTGSEAWRLYLAARIDPTAGNVAQLMTYVGERLENMENPSAGIGFATLAYGTFGRTEEIFKALLGWPKRDDLAILSEVFFRPELRQFRRDPRFMQIAKRAGLLDYWRESGHWPDFCFEADQPYDCKAEAAKLS